ncbi:hypothetical protein [Embleya hyalina]|uniref:Uncharacterized protein n=1 Tax=Embleya hyalina TaxID=516124 RepID=A0A401YVA4_9ACTN|nr:hypothetical protein [Embleya hyalina]GCD98509.1 hypothetical protein EHYA_06216 [Embleya hyalina]
MSAVRCPVAPAAVESESDRADGEPVGSGGVSAAPIDLTAFRPPDRARWARSARLRVVDPVRGGPAVRSAVADLVGTRADVPRGPDPTAGARHIPGRVATALPPARGTPYDALPWARAGAVAPHRRLGMTATAAADLMGTDPPEPAARSVPAERGLPAAVVRTPERRPDAVRRPDGRDAPIHPRGPDGPGGG